MSQSGFVVKHIENIIKLREAAAEAKRDEKPFTEEETKKFVQDTLGNLGSGDEFSQEAFDEVFSTFDKDGSGTVDKKEMVTFIKQLLGN
mgnify:CR=1 FL=1